ncbi:hypothetical protein ACLOJK_016753 [Asimina triloba]
MSPRFLGYFLFHSSFRRQPSDLKSNSIKEQSAHVASVKNILESHASFLMSGKELSKLVAFVKGTQFDLVEYLQREKSGSARLENFASGLELIGQKWQNAGCCPVCRSSRRRQQRLTHDPSVRLHFVCLDPPGASARCLHQSRTVCPRSACPDLVHPLHICITLRPPRPRLDLPRSSVPSHRPATGVSAASAASVSSALTSPRNPSASIQRPAAPALRPAA